MNIRKNVDYSPMFDAMRVAMSSDIPQMNLYYELGRLICQRTEKGAAVSAAEYLQRNYPDVPGLSPRNLRRMRDFYRVYEGTPELLDLAMQIGWTQNVVILEADLNTEERRWYLCAINQFGWAKAKLQRRIKSHAHQEVHLDESENQCYTKHENDELDRTEYDQDTFSVPRQYLQKSNGRVCHEIFTEESRSGTRVSLQIGCHQHRGNRQSGLSTCQPQVVPTWYQLLWQGSPPTHKQPLRIIRFDDWHRPVQPARYVPNLWWRLRRQNAPADGFCRPSRRGSRSMVHRRL